MADNEVEERPELSGVQQVEFCLFLAKGHPLGGLFYFAGFIFDLAPVFIEYSATKYRFAI